MSDPKNHSLCAISFHEREALRCRHLRSDQTSEAGGTVAVFGGTVQFDRSVPRVARLCPFCLGIVHALILNMGEAKADTD